jgi:hypothetical protein
LFEFFESVGVGVGHNKLSLCIEYSPCESRDVGAIVRSTNIGDELIGGVPKPHGFDITSYDVSRFAAVGQVVVLNSGGDSIGKSFGEDAIE